MPADRPTPPRREHDGYEVVAKNWSFGHSGPLGNCTEFLADTGGPDMSEVYAGLANTKIPPSTAE